MHDWSILPHGLAVDEAETTEQVILVGLASNVDTVAFSLHLGADLFNHGGLAVTGKSRDERRVEDSGLDDHLDRLEMSPRHVGRDPRRNEGRTLTTSHAHDGMIGDGLDRRGRSRSIGKGAAVGIDLDLITVGIVHDVELRVGSLHGTVEVGLGDTGRSGRHCRGDTEGGDLGHTVLASPNLAGRILRNP